MSERFLCYYYYYYYSIIIITIIISLLLLLLLFHYHYYYYYVFIALPVLEEVISDLKAVKISKADVQSAIVGLNAVMVSVADDIDSTYSGCTGCGAQPNTTDLRNGANFDPSTVCPLSNRTSLPMTIVSAASYANSVFSLRCRRLTRSSPTWRRSTPVI